MSSRDVDDWIDNGGFTHLALYLSVLLVILTAANHLRLNSA